MINTYIRPMKTLLLTLSFALSFLSFSYAQSDSAAAEIKVLLPPGQHVAKIIGPSIPQLTPREKELQAKIVKAVMAHPEFFQDSIKKGEDLGKMFEKLGLTPEEMEEYGKLIEKKNETINVTGSDTLEIIHTNNTISFSGNGRLRPLDSLQINFDVNEAVFRRQAMPYIGVTVKKASEGLFPSVLKGYDYAYEPLPDTTKGLMHVTDNMVRYNLYVGQMEATGETVVFLMAFKNVDKRTILNIALPFILPKATVR